MTFICQPSIVLNTETLVEISKMTVGPYYVQTRYAANGTFHHVADCKPYRTLEEAKAAEAALGCEKQYSRIVNYLGQDIQTED